MNEDDTAAWEEWWVDRLRMEPYIDDPRVGPTPPYWFPIDRSNAIGFAASTISEGFIAAHRERYAGLYPIAGAVPGYPTQIRTIIEAHFWVLPPWSDVWELWDDVTSDYDITDPDVRQEFLSTIPRFTLHQVVRGRVEQDAVQAQLSSPSDWLRLTAYLNEHFPLPTQQQIDAAYEEWFGTEPLDTTGAATRGAA